MKSLPLALVPRLCLGCVRISLARWKRRYADATMKFETGAQWVKVPPGQSLASRPVASLAQCRVTGGVKRRQRASGPHD